MFKWINTKYEKKLYFGLPVIYKQLQAINKDKEKLNLS